MHVFGQGRMLETRYIGAIDYPPFKKRLTLNRVVMIEIGDVTINSHMSTDDMQLMEFSSININNAPADVFGMWTCTKLQTTQMMNTLSISSDQLHAWMIGRILALTSSLLILENDRITVSCDTALTKMLFGCVPTGHIDEYMSQSEIIVYKDKDSHVHIHPLPNDFAEYWMSIGTKACIGAIGNITFIAMVPFAFEPSKKKSAKTNNGMVARDPAASFRRHVVNE